MCALIPSSPRWELQLKFVHRSGLPPARQEVTEVEAATSCESVTQKAVTANGPEQGRGWPACRCGSQPGQQRRPPKGWSKQFRWFNLTMFLKLSVIKMHHLTKVCVDLWSLNVLEGNMCCVLNKDIRSWRSAHKFFFAINRWPQFSLTRLCIGYNVAH